MGKKLGSAIKAARTGAGFTQAQLAEKVAGASQSDIGRFERGEAEPTAQVVKEIAKACGVTQKSLLDLMPKSSTKPSSSTKPASSAKPASTAKPSTSSKPSSSTKPSSAAKSSMRVTATEKRLVELYRAADADTRKKALAILRGTDAGAADDGVIGVDDIISGLGTLLGDVLGKK